MSLKDFMRHHSIIFYFTLAFVIPWGTILLIASSTGLPSTESTSLVTFFLVFLSMIAGPSVAGITLTGIVDGKEGLRTLLARQKTWRVGAFWWGAALFLIPFVLIVVVSVLSLVSPIFTLGILGAEDKVYFVAFAIIGGFLAGFFEEIGWTGFALPRMQARYGVLEAALMLGMLHGAWHFLGDYWGNGTTFSSLFLPRILLWIVAITALRFLISWVYNNSRSLLLAQIMHASFTGGQALLQPNLTPLDYIAFYAGFTFVLWIVVALIIIIFGRTLVRQSLRPQP